MREGGSEGGSEVETEGERERGGEGPEGGVEASGEVILFSLMSWALITATNFD